MTVEIDSTRLRAALRKLGDELSDPSDALDAIGLSLAANIRDNLGQGLDYRGTPFAPLKNPNERRTGKSPRVSPEPLNDTRLHIYKRINHQLEGRDAVAVGLLDTPPSEESIGPVHQFGDPRRNIPARPFLPITPTGQPDIPQDWEDEIVDIIEAKLKEALA